MNNAVTTQREQPVTRETAPTNKERAYVSPPVNIYENKDAFILEAEMPGVNKDGLEITLEGNALTLVGRRSDEWPSGQATYRESKGWHYRRVFELDPALDTGNISARMEQGILTLTLPKAEKEKPRKIKVG